MMPGATSHGQSATNCGRVDAGVGCNPWAERRTEPQCQHKQFSRDSAVGCATVELAGGELDVDTAEDLARAQELFG